MLGAAACAALLAMVPAAAEEPANTFSPVPPGSVAQSQLFVRNGEAMQRQWRAVASKKLLGSANGTQFYQWYLSIYAIDGSTYRLRYQSPVNGGPLSRVTQANGAKMWFPIQQLQIVGSVELMQPGVQQLVVQSHEAGADCGMSVVTILTASTAGAIAPAVSVRNSCALRATIATASAGDSIALSGPYYGPNAPLCCPTKPNATATLSYRNGKWSVTPNYFPFYPGRFPPD